MKHLFLPYELAVIAKEKGFDDECLYAWVERDDLSDYPEIGTFLEEPDEFPSWTDYNKYDSLCSAPLYQQIVDFLIEKGIFAHVSDFPIYNGKYGYRYGKGRLTGGFIPFDTNRYITWNKAIEEAFKLI